MNNLVIRKSKHVIINEEHDADRLKTIEKTYDDARCVQFNVQPPPPTTMTTTTTNDELTDRKTTYDVLLWKRDESVREQLTNENKNLDDVANLFEATVQNSKLLKFIDKLMNMVSSIYDCLANMMANERLWNVFIVILYVFYNVLFHLVMGVATIMIAVILNLEESCDNYENKMIECNLKTDMANIREYETKIDDLDEKIKSNEECYKRLMAFQ